MTTVTITLTDGPKGGVSVHSSFKPAIGSPCSPAQSLSLDLIGLAKRCSCSPVEMDRDVALALLAGTSTGRQL